MSKFTEMPAQEEAFHLAEQWIETLAQIGVLQKGTEDDQQKKWIVTDHQQDCHVTIQRDFSRGRDSLGNTFRVADILLTSLHPTLLDRLLEAGQASYQAIQWTLLGDLDILALAKQVHAQMGRPYFHATQVENAYHVKYGVCPQLEQKVGIGS
jgi:hypothetical protein